MKLSADDWCFTMLVTTIGNREDAKDELIGQLASMDVEIRDKDRDKYSIEELTKMVKKTIASRYSKGTGHG